ncbi:BTAD domain-containing putative transcriptional regulator [Streptomyces sp. B6B3]|uniref:BTAD domain-containing putative transcriptional regulator n=1 Tax=Streptomyces sp. B6B3 TaxID=3153570 RepID=UPI00325DF017
MRFGVLGPLAVWAANGAPVRVPERKVRAVLARLLVRPGHPVSADRLADQLWGTRPPRNPAGALQGKIAHLRRALDEAEPGGRRLVVSGPAGYRLDVPPGDVDAGRFAELAARAGATADPARRAGLLVEALDLWRGPAFADHADEPFARAAIDRLTEDRLGALEQLAEARLALGEHALVLGELADLVARHPLRERLRAAQLRALYRAGRQGEALAGYEAFRRRLADELGLDPGPELTALHQAILRQDPALNPAPDRAPYCAPDSAPVARPRTNLPAPLTDLVGRSGAVADLRGLLRTARLVTLTGPGGVGKSRLAVETARGLLDAYPEGAWLVELAGLAADAPAEEVVCALAESVLQALAVRPDAAPASGIDWLAAALRGRRPLLLVLDNCEHVVEPVAGFAEALLRAVPDLRILATSREPLGLGGETVWRVPPLAPADATRLFLSRAGRPPDAELDPADAEAVAAICRRLDGLPVALELAASRVRTLGLHGLHARLDDRFSVLTSGYRDAPPRQRTLRAVLDWSWELLTAGERTVLRRLAVQVDGCTLEAAEQLCAGGGVRPAEVLDALARLVDRSLVVLDDRPGDPRYRLLESVREYCAERLREAGEFHEAERRHVHYYAELAEEAEPLLRGPEQRRWLARLDAESGNLRRAIDLAATRGAAEAALRLVNALTWYWVLRGRLSEAHRALTRTTTLPAPAGAATVAAEPRPAVAAPAATSSTAPVVGDPTPAAVAADLTVVAPADRATADPASANPVPAAADRADRAARVPGAAVVPGSGPASVAAGRAAAWRAGVVLLVSREESADPRPVLDGLAAAGDRAGLAVARWFLAFAQLGTAAVAGGERLSRQAVADFRELGDRWGEAAALSVLARHALARGALAAARDHGERADRVFRALGDRWGQAHTVFPLATLAEIAGDYPRAAALHRTGLGMAEELGLWAEVVNRLCGLGRIALLTGDHAGADALHGRALALATEQNLRRGQASAELGLALGARRAGDLDAAESRLRRLLDWFRATDYGPGLGVVLAELGFVAELRGDPETARSRHAEGLAQARLLGDPRAVALAWEGLAGAAAGAGRHRRAATLLGAAAAARESARAPLPAAERADVDRIAAAARAALGEEAFAAAFAHGATLDEPDA